MRHVTRSGLGFTLLVALALLVAPLLGCGGSGGTNNGGGTGGLTNAVLSGTYVVTAFESFLMNTDTEATFGSAAFDGAGMVTPTVGTNNDTVVTAPMAQPAVAYSVAADGTLTLPGSTGGATNDGLAAVFMNSAAGSSPQMGFAFKPTGAFNQATFSGSYHSGQLIAVNGGPATSVWTTTALGLNTTAGAGMMTLPANFMRNIAGAIAMNPGGAVVPYTVMGTGAMQLFMLGMIGEGGIVSDGSFAVFAGGSDPVNPQIAAYVKQSVAATNAAFSGSYWAVGISSDPTDMNRWTSFVGTVTADGAGNMNYASTTENYEGAISTPSGPDTYTVGGDGTLASSGGARIGAITQDGRFAFQCGDTQMNGPPMLFLFVRK